MFNAGLEPITKLAKLPIEFCDLRSEANFGVSNCARSIK